MRIMSSTVQLGASSTALTSVSRQEALEVWVGQEEPQGRGAPAATPARPTLAAPVGPPPAAGPKAPALPATPADPQGQGDQAPRAAEAEGGASQALTQKDELDLAILLKMFRLRRGLTRSAQEVRKAYDDPRPGEDAARLVAADRAAMQAPAEVPPREGWGLRYDLKETSLHYESTSFAASAAVTTADGRTFQVQAALAMERVEATSREVHVQAGDAAKVDPLVLNLSGGPATLAGAASFDLDADGAKERVATLGAGSAYLALDRNANGAIDSGAELFGPTTGSGFGELAALDGDGNGWIDEGDAAYARLRLWSPAGGALTSLQAAGVGAIFTGAAATPFDLKDGGAVVGSVAETGLFLREDGTAGTVQHVDLVA